MKRLIYDGRVFRMVDDGSGEAAPMTKRSVTLTPARKLANDDIRRKIIGGAYGNLPLVMLAADACRFPITDQAPHVFCGKRTGGPVYCVEHARRCGGGYGKRP